MENKKKVVIIALMAALASLLAVLFVSFLLSVEAQSRAPASGNTASNTVAIATSNIVAVTGITIITNERNAAPQNGTTYSPSYCYITPELYCYQMLVVSNSVGTSISIAFANNYGSSIYLPSNNALLISPSPTGQYYPGSCSDPSTNAPVGVLKPGASVICVADIPGLVIQPGTQLEPTFYLNYYMCKDPACGISARSAALQSTSGSAVAYAVPVAPATTTSAGSGIPSNALNQSAIGGLSSMPLNLSYVAYMNYSFTGRPGSLYTYYTSISGPANKTLNSVATATKGFSVRSVSPRIPAAVNASAATNFNITIALPDSEYSGNLILVFNYT